MTEHGSQVEYNAASNPVVADQQQIQHLGDQQQVFLEHHVAMQEGDQDQLNSGGYYGAGDVNNAFYQQLLMNSQMLQMNGGFPPSYRLPTNVGNSTTAEFQHQLGGIMEEEPIYVNAKQYQRILIRREQRAKMEAKSKLDKQKKTFVHESRHIHAQSRRRSGNGRFLSKKDKENMAAIAMEHHQRQQQFIENRNGDISATVTSSSPSSILEHQHQFELDDNNINIEQNQQHGNGVGSGEDIKFRSDAPEEVMYKLKRDRKGN
jgi:hypothetical protein